jgi:hypothetical protein
MMPIPTVQCALCGKEVTKRSTLSLAALGSDNVGRACRNHEEIALLVQALEEQTKAKRELREIDQALRIMSAAAMVRMSCSLYHVSPETLYARFQMAGILPGVIEKVKAEVARLGGPIMTSEEILQLGMNLADILERARERAKSQPNAGPES